MSQPTNPPVNPPTDDDPATLRARLEKRYERPERPCTYDPDGDPLWFERARAQLDAPPVEPVLVMSPANAERFNRELAAACAMPERYDPADEEPEAEPVSRVDIEHRWTNPEAPPLSLRMEYEQADWTPPRPEPVEYSGIPVVVPTVAPPITDTTDPEWVRQIHGAPPGQPVRLLAAGSADDYTAEMAEHRATIYRAQGYTGVSVSVFRPEPQPPREECPACGEYGWHDSRCNLDSYHLRSYLSTLTNPDAPAEDVAAALDLLTDEDFALVDPRNVEGFKLLAALPLMKRERVAPTKRNP